MKNLVNIFGYTTLISVIVLTSCVSDSEEDLFAADDGNGGCATTVSFQDEIADIITTNCAIPGCHNGDLGASRDWTDFSALQRSAQAVRSRTGARTMPPANSGITLTDAQIGAIACWVEQGAQNN